MPTEPSSENSFPNPKTTSTNDDYWYGTRSRKQFSLFVAGAVCVSLSIFSTRRALLRRYHATVPLFYQQSNAPPRQPFSLQKEAVEALRIATVNVLSIAFMVGAGGLWATDTWGGQELREKLAKMKQERQVRGGRDEVKDREAEQEFEDFLGPSLLKRKKEEKGEEQR
ncbi:MAG: hypothetical protein Q9174_002578 [Haloplaca sp. 1 TL-2023]